MSTRVRQAFQSAAGAAGGGGLDVDEVFSTYLYEGNSSTQTITNGIDLDGEGGLAWLKARSGTVSHKLLDTEVGLTKARSTDATAADITYNPSFPWISSFNTDGFTLGYNSQTNFSGTTYTSWTFRKAPKFFDVQTWSGDSASDRAISHNLGCVPGMIIVKRTNASEDWGVWHRSVHSNTSKVLYLNQNFNLQTSTHIFGATNPTDSNFYVGNHPVSNNSGDTYVAYLFAHNDGDGDFGPDGDADIIKCGSWTASSTAAVPVDLGFEPQWVLIKRAPGTQDWLLWDTMRGMPVDTGQPYLIPNSSGAESTDTYYLSPTPTGFTVRQNALGSNGDTYIYIAIRRGPMAVPESASEVFDVQEVTGNGTARTFTTGTTVDFVMSKASNVTYGWRGTDRVRGSGFPFLMDSNSSESNNYTIGHWLDATDGFEIISGSNPYNASGYDYTHWAWTRAPNFFDIVAWEGTGAYTTTINHNLGVTPEMIWVKNRSLSEDWAVYHKAIGTYYGPSGTTGGVLQLDDNSGVSDTGINSTSYWRDQAPDADAFYLGNQNRVNGSGYNYAAYLFASLDGVSKVGSYTGTGSDQTIDCGFSNGASFVLVKRYDVGSQSWHVWDSARGITAGNDSTHFLDLSQQENTSSNYIDPHSSGFTLKSSFTATNASGGSYIFYAIAAI